MPELTENQIADLRALQDHCRSLGADLVIIGLLPIRCISRDKTVTRATSILLSLWTSTNSQNWNGGFWLTKWIRLANREPRWRSPRGTILDLLPAGPKLREAKQVLWPASQFRMSLVGFDHVFETAQPVPFAPDLTLKVIPSTTLMLLKIVAFMDDQQRRAKDLEDIRGLLAEYEADPPYPVKFGIVSAPEGFLDRHLLLCCCYCTFV
jgi:hypothetical protein